VGVYWPHSGSQLEVPAEGVRRRLQPVRLWSSLDGQGQKEFVATDSLRTEAGQEDVYAQDIT